MGGACSADGGSGKLCTGLWWGNLRERDHLEDPGVDGMIILRWGSGYGQVAGTCDCGNEPSGCIKCGGIS
jgi:hypothetical protein